MADFMQLDMSKVSAKGILASFILLLVGVVFSIRGQLAGPKTFSLTDRCLKCSNPTCDWGEVISVKQYQERARGQLEKYRAENPQAIEQMIQQTTRESLGPMAGGGMMDPAMGEESLISMWGTPDWGLAFTCPKCGQDKVYNAYKCEKCGEFFFTSTALGGHGDKCPKCGYSKAEERMKESKAKKGKK